MIPENLTKQTISFYTDPSHIVTYGNQIQKNTWADWRLVAESRPVFAPPKPKTTYIDIPGGNGSLDLSESLTGYPVYNNREGTFKFRVMNGYMEWFERYSEIMEYLHGRKLYAVLNDDPNWFYSGRFSVDAWDSGDTWSEVTIGYNVNPFKWSISSSTDDWLWDPFNFNTGIIRQQKFANIEVNGTEESPTELTFGDQSLFGTVPVSPTIFVSGTDIHGIKIKFVNNYLQMEYEETFKNGSTFVPDFVFYSRLGPDEFMIDGIYKMYLVGTGTISIDFRVGRL